MRKESEKLKAAVCGESITNQKRSSPEGTRRSFAPQSRSARPSSPTAAAFSMPAISPTTQNAASRTPLHTRVITLRSLRCSARTHLLLPSLFPVRLRRTNALIPISRKNFATYFVAFLRFSTSNFVVWQRKTFFRVGIRRNPTNYPDLTDWKLP